MKLTNCREGLQMSNAQKHLTSSIVMVRPTDFAFNPQTSVDNEFQHRPNTSDGEITRKALTEFSQMVNQLEAHSIDVNILEKAANSPSTPDAVFPNNWFTTDAQGNITLFPMKTPNRQSEVKPSELSALLGENYLVNQCLDVKKVTGLNAPLEGTGSIVFHHPTKTAYAAISERCEPKQFAAYCDSIDYQQVAFSSLSSHGKPFYHTNVMMAAGEAFAIVCLASLEDQEEKNNLIQNLENHCEDIVDISFDQTESAFCGNMLQLYSRKDYPLIVMSLSALNALDSSQKRVLEKHGELLGVDVTTIETIGGGSARCMIAENFLPSKN